MVFIFKLSLSVVGSPKRPKSIFKTLKMTKKIWYRETPVKVALSLPGERPDYSLLCLNVSTQKVAFVTTKRETGL